MQIQNDYDKEVFNGDIGYIKAIDLETNELNISFEDRIVTYDFGELDQVVPAYAITVHKSQGSEYPAVIVPLVMQHYAMLQKNLVYTAITRGKKLVIIVGEKKALAVAIKKKNLQTHRISKLKDWLQY
jgi:exodeoxyribonuclease V alpha subunit